MGKCNLLAPINQPTGNFLLFSQYSEDLTRSTNSEDFYRVVPSKYVLIDLNPKEGWDSVKYAEFFQNYYENACSVMRKNRAVGWTPDCATSMLWKSLIKSGLVDEPEMDETNGVYTSKSVVGTGDINITSVKQYDGVYYSETYISVPQGSPRRKYEFTKYGAELTRIAQWPEQNIVGYTDEEYPTAGENPWPSNHLSEEYADGTVVVDGQTEYVYELRSANDFNFVPESVSSLEDDHYSFNCVMVLYDVYKKGVEDSTESILYSGVPMGLYFTGQPGDDGSIQNPATIWVVNEDIYRQGTSYGFRICTRYLSTQNQLFIVDSTVEDTMEMYDQYAAVMAKIGDSQIKMDQIVQMMSEYQNDITNHLANIKNYKVNVPYIRNIGGVNYWFVNGKNLGVTTTETTLVWENY